MQFRVGLICLFLLWTSLLFAQEGDSLPRIKKFFFVDSILISGNKVTSERVLLNEMAFRVGDSLSLDEIGGNLKAIRENLLNTSLFNFVWVTATPFNGNRLKINITVQERWYWWVMPIIEHADRNFSSFINDGDWSRIRYGGFVENANFLGRKKLLRLRVKLGYQQVFNLSFQSPQYKYKTGWGVAVDYLTQAQVQVATVNDRPLFFHLDNQMGIVKVTGRILFNYRHDLYHHHQLTLTYNRLSANDSIGKLNPNYLYQSRNEIQYLQLEYTYNKDTRDSKIYPLSGRYYGFDVNNIGFGIWEKGMNYLFGAVHYRRYFPLTRRFNLGTQWDAFVANKRKLPYYINFGLGYQDFINGYEYNVIEGSSYFTSQNRFMFNLLPTRTWNIKFIPWGQFSKIHYAFYLKTFLDFGYVYNKYPVSYNRLTNELLVATGLGLDFVTYYDKVFGVSYSINRFGQSGIYLHIDLKL